MTDGRSSSNIPGTYGGAVMIDDNYQTNSNGGGGNGYGNGYGYGGQYGRFRY